MSRRICLCFSVLLVTTSLALTQNNPEEKTPTATSTQPAPVNNCTQAVANEDEEIKQEDAEIKKVETEVDEEGTKTTIADVFAGLASILSGIAAFRDQVLPLFGRRKA